MMVFRAITPDPATLLTNLVTFLAAVNPNFGGYMPKWSDGTVRWMPEGATYDEDWMGQIVQVPATELGVDSPGRCRLDAVYKAAGARVLYDANGDPVMSGEDVVTRATPRQIDMIASVEHDPALTVDALTAVISAFIGTFTTGTYAVQQDLQDQGVPATLSLPMDSGGNAYVTPANPFRRY